MTENKRYIDNGFEAIEEQSFTDTQNGKTYYVDYFDEIVDLLNEQDKQIKELKEDNDQKFWKHRCMEQYNTTQVIMHELGLAIRDGYEMSSKMRAYLDELKERNREIEKKYKRLEESV